ncbi:MAG: beta-ketoacyl-[acyl-carrier-protein] synthase family protein [Chitinophagaceae bacterium]|nr:beta-ketoacyl-[acyl-carrier-protein] synthase family protein [Chitinophagaceae bacterium]
MSRIFVTGMGMVSAIGNSIADNRHALMQGTSGISKPQFFSSKYSDIPMGEVKTDTESLREELGAWEQGVTRTMLLALKAFKEAIEDAEISFSSLTDETTSLVNASTVGGMCLTDELYNDANKHSNGSEFLASYDTASVSLYLQARYGLKGIINTINTACSSSANAILYGARLIKSGIARRAIVGGVDSLAKFTVNGFNALHILSSGICSPFDEQRNGLNLGEGAAFLILEREEDLHGKKVYAELTGYGNANDAYHPSSLSPNGDGPYLAMKKAVDCLPAGASMIDLINAHGTGTENNDEVESRAMLRLFKSPPAFVSTKAATGHTLGAAGAIEAAYAVLNLHHQEVYASLNFKQPISSTGLTPVLNYEKAALKNVMSNSFGFGGNCTSLIFSKV